MKLEKNKLILSATLFIAILLPVLTYAQANRQVISVTPPLFQISVAPGDIWQSSIRVVNGNPYELPIYTELVNFAPHGEAGLGRFTPLVGGDTTATLADWIEISGGPYNVLPEQSFDIPFFIDVPKDAPPGGHFAAVLVGTEPPKQEGDPLVVQTSQSVASLFFLRIEGDVVENGNIREFSVTDRVVGTPEASFVLRFENKGNVHLLPRGDIIITNMWGKERGIIPINHKSHFGNVLPSSIREFNFAWSGATSLADIGRYKAVVTLAYGEDGIKSDHQTTYFWVIPVKGAFITLGLLVAFILFMVWAIRLYIRKTLALAGVDVNSIEDSEDQEYATDEEHDDIDLSDDVKETKVPQMSYKLISEPIRQGAIDLRAQLREVSEFVDVFKTIVMFVVRYKLFFGTLLVLVLAFVSVAHYIHLVSEERSYQVTIEEGGAERTVDSEEILKERMQHDTGDNTNTQQPFVFEVVNASGEPGLAAERAVSLEENGFVVNMLRTEDSVNETTKLYFDSSLEEIAQELNEFIEGDIELVSVQNKRDDVTDMPVLELMIGVDQSGQ